MNHIQFSKKVKELLPIDGESFLKEPITTTRKVCVGYNYETELYEYANQTVLLTGICRMGKKGIVRITNDFNQYFNLCEFTEKELNHVWEKIGN